VLRVALLEAKESEDQILPPPDALGVEGSHPASPVV